MCITTVLKIYIFHSRRVFRLARFRYVCIANVRRLCSKNECLKLFTNIYFTSGGKIIVSACSCHGNDKVSLRHYCIITEMNKRPLNAQLPPPVVHKPVTLIAESPESSLIQHTNHPIYISTGEPGPNRTITTTTHKFLRFMGRLGSGGRRGSFRVQSWG